MSSTILGEPFLWNWTLEKLDKNVTIDKIFQTTWSECAELLNDESIMGHHFLLGLENVLDLEIQRCEEYSQQVPLGSVHERACSRLLQLFSSRKDALLQVRRLHLALGEVPKHRYPELHNRVHKKQVESYQTLLRIRELLSKRQKEYHLEPDDFEGLGETFQGLSSNLWDWLSKEIGLVPKTIKNHLTKINFKFGKSGAPNAAETIEKLLTQ